jgi:hypothetical protein
VGLRCAVVALAGEVIVDIILNPLIDSETLSVDFHRLAHTVISCVQLGRQSTPRPRVMTLSR